MSEPYQRPEHGEMIGVDASGQLQVPDQPVIPFIEGDGVGPDIWKATRHVLDAAVEHAYQGRRQIAWYEVYAGEKARDTVGEWLPQRTLDEIENHVAAIKGPLTTPVGRGFRSLNVAIRKELDLYACIRPCRWFEGVPSPVKNPQDLDIVVFRENTEDVYSGIEFPAGSDEANRLSSVLAEMDQHMREGSAVGVKPVSEHGSKRLIRKAIQYAIDQGRDSVTMVHKGNIMKFTEGAFRDWGYELAREEFPDQTLDEDELWEKHDGRIPEGKVLIRDRIADAMFQQLLLRPQQYDVLATLNLNGDYLSDAAVAQVGGLGLAPGANVGDRAAVFEATHGTAPKYAGQDKVNPASLLLSGVMLLQHIGWQDAANAVLEGLGRTFAQKRVTYDLHRQLEGATKLSCSGFAEAIVENLG